MKTSPGILPVIVAVETDPLQFHGEAAVHPEPLDMQAADQLIAHIAADLTKLFPEVSRFGLCMSGALYDQAQLLQPHWPLFAAMTRVEARRRQKESGAPGMVSIGTSGGHMPEEFLIPSQALPPGMLQLIPLQLSGDPQDLADLEDSMEHRFMEEGQLSPLTARAIENAFGVNTTHIRFLTVTDLQAMLKLQLEHFGFAALWTLLDSALEGVTESVSALGNGGQEFRWDGEQVNARFETFNFWSHRGSGKDVEAGSLGNAYTDWTREYRQILVTLQAHGVPVVQHLPNDDAPLEGLYFVESAGPSGGAAAAITEHGGEAMGTLAVTVIHDGEMLHYYPLAPEGSNALHQELAGMGIAHEGLSFPGCVCFNPETRELIADCD